MFDLHHLTERTATNDRHELEVLLRDFLKRKVLEEKRGTWPLREATTRNGNPKLRPQRTIGKEKKQENKNREQIRQKKRGVAVKRESRGKTTMKGVRNVDSEAMVKTPEKSIEAQTK